MPQTVNYAERIARMQAALAEHGLEAIVLESGPGMMYLTGVRWGKSERTFAVVIARKGAPLWVVPGFEEMRARELIRPGDDVRIWEEDESPFARIVEGLKARGVAAGKVAIDDNARFFVFDGIRKLAPKLEFTGSEAALKAVGVGAQ